MALSWLPGVREGLEAQGWRIQNLTMAQCPTADVQIVATNGVGGAEIPGFNDECSAHRTWALEQAQKIKPDLVIMSNNKAALKSGATGEKAHQEWTAGYQSYLLKFKEVAKKVVILGFPAEGKNLAECVTKFNHPADCSTVADLTLEGLSREKMNAILLAGKEGVAATYVDPTPWLCTADKKCPPFVGTTPVRVDAIHLTDAYSKKLGPALAQALLGPAT